MALLLPGETLRIGRLGQDLERLALGARFLQQRDHLFLVAPQRARQRRVAVLLGQLDVIRIGDDEFRFEADPTSFEPDVRREEDASIAARVTEETTDELASLEVQVAAVELTSL